jgi:hypothetical protein
MQECRLVDVPLSVYLPEASDSDGGFDQDAENAGPSLNADPEQRPLRTNAAASTCPGAAVLAPQPHVTVEDVQLDAKELRDALVCKTINVGS